MEGHARMGFATTASYFEERAAKARHPSSRELFKEAASFYRQLANVAPGFPPGWDPRKVRLHLDPWRSRAEECRTMAELFSDATCRERMMRLADTYDRLAALAD